MKVVYYEDCGRLEQRTYIIMYMAWHLELLVQERKEIYCIRYDLMISLVHETFSGDIISFEIEN